MSGLVDTTLTLKPQSRVTLGARLKMKSKRVGRRKRCPVGMGCGKRKSIKKFSVNRSKPDGRCVYCSDCTSRMSKNYRDKLKVTIGRTSLRVPKGIMREETVKRLLNETPRTREELDSLTGYGEDTVGAVLAKLYDRGLVKIQKESRRFELKSPRNTVMARTSLAA